MYNQWNLFFLIYCRLKIWLIHLLFLFLGLFYNIFRWLKRVSSLNCIFPLSVPPSFHEADICYLFVIIVETCEWVIVKRKVIKQGHIKIKFKTFLILVDLIISCHDCGRSAELKHLSVLKIIYIWAYPLLFQ